MARIVATRSATSVELQNGTDVRYWFEIVQGGLDSRPSVRGTNLVKPGAEGQVFFSKVEHDFPLTLHGPVGQVTGEPYLALMDDIHAVFQIGAEVLIEVHPDARGVGGRVPTGSIASTTVEVLRIVGPPAVGDEVRQISIECVGITAPLGWTVEAS